MKWNYAFVHLFIQEWVEGLPENGRKLVNIMRSGQDFPRKPIHCDPNVFIPCDLGWLSHNIATGILHIFAVKSMAQNMPRARLAGHLVRKNANLESRRRGYVLARCPSHGSMGSLQGALGKSQGEWGSTGIQRNIHLDWGWNFDCHIDLNDLKIF